MSDSADWFSYLYAHREQVEAFCFKYFTAEQTCAWGLALDEANRSTLERLLNKAWFVSPDAKSTRDEPGFFEVCNLCDGGYVDWAPDDKGKTKTESNEKLYALALDKWGRDAQLNMVVEECAELIVKLGHYRRERATKESVLDELADVSIMVNQACHILGITDNELESAIKFKLNRLAERLSCKA
jgi:NTP pyrophosphatase (non-canonical NTP hydrolase)